MFTLKSTRFLLASSGLAILAACGGGGSDPAPIPPPATTYTIGGTVAGLSGSGLVLQLNGGSNLTVAANGAFTFPGSVSSGAAYAVTVSTQPSSPTQTCTVASGSGTASANVTNITVTCSTVTFTVGGTITGLVGTGLVLRNNGQNATITGSSFVFPAQASGSAYAVTVLTQPGAPPQTCLVASGSGTLTANVTNVTVTCTTNQFVVSGTIAGYTGTGLVLRRTIGAATTDHPVSAGATGFAFPAQNDLTTYAITVLTQPSTPAQNCVVTNGSGTLAGGNVSNVVVTCSTSNFTVGGTVSGLLGTGLVLRNNGGDNKTIAANGTYTFATSVNSGSAYAVTVFAQPTAPAQTCTVTGGTGTIAANVTNANITCVSVDLTPPTVSSKTPLDTTVGTNLATTIVANFSEALMPASVTATTFTLTSPSGSVVGVLSLPPGNTQAIFTPSQPLAFNTTYTATLTTGIQDASGNGLASNVVWTFNTGHKVAAGGYHTCARLAGANNGKVKCWGSNSFGQLGLGINTPVGVAGGQMGAALPEVILGVGRTAVDIVAGENFTCARLDDGSLKCWGRNNEGQLGLGDQFVRGDSANDMATLTPVNFGVGVTVLEVVAGAQHACARLSDTSVRCWGNNDSGIVGHNTADPRFLTPVSVDMGTGLRAVGLAANGSFHTCARLVNASGVDAGVKCWGDNAFGQLGQGDTVARGDNLNPMGTTVLAINLGAGLSATQVVATSGHTCALLSNNTVKCWGNNWFGQMGRGTGDSQWPVVATCAAAEACISDVPGETPNSLAAVDLGTGLTAVQLAGGDRQTCARLSNNTVKCWGWNGYGQLGKGDTATRGDSANEMGDNLTAIPLGTFVVAEVSAGGFHECAVSDAGAVKCWGFNGTQIPFPGSFQGGQLGLGVVESDNRGDGANEMGANLPAVDLTPAP